MQRATIVLVSGIIQLDPSKCTTLMFALVTLLMATTTVINIILYHVSPTIVINIIPVSSTTLINIIPSWCVSYMYDTT